jgi:hypothetical protein
VFDQLLRRSWVGLEEVGLDQQPLLALEEFEGRRRREVDRCIAGDRADPGGERLGDDREEGIRRAEPQRRPAGTDVREELLDDLLEADRRTISGFVHSVAVARHVMVEDVEQLAAIADIVIPDEDLEPLAAALEAHLQFVEPLLRRDLSAVPPAVRFDPKAHWSTSTR